MKAVQVSKPGGNFEIVERPIPQPGRGQVRIKVEACGICHSDALVKEGHWPGLQYPRVPGHEIAGRIDAIGADVTLWKPGQRVGVGWHGGHCFQCDPCRRGDFVLCQFEKITAISFDGGYAEYMVAPAEAVAAMPDDLPAEKPRRCSARESLSTIRCAMQERARRPGRRAGHWRSRATSEFNMPARWASAPSPSVAAKTSSRWPRSWALTTTWTPGRRSCRSVAETWRSARDSGHRPRFEIDLGSGRRTGGKWQAADRGRGFGVSHGHSAATDWRAQGHPGLALGHG